MIATIPIERGDRKDGLPEGSEGRGIGPALVLSATGKGARPWTSRGIVRAVRHHHERGIVPGSVGEALLPRQTRDRSVPPTDVETTAKGSGAEQWSRIPGVDRRACAGR